MDERFTIEAGGYEVMLDGNAKDRLQWFGSCEYEHQRMVREWKGVGVIVYPHKKNQRRPFHFHTDSWNENEAKWKRSLKDSVVSFVDEDGNEVTPSGPVNPELLNQFIIAAVISELEYKDEEVLPTIHIRPLHNTKELISSGAVTEFVRMGR